MEGRRYRQPFRGIISLAVPALILAAWRRSGAAESSVPVGAHTVEFSGLSGWIKPVNQVITVAASQTSTATGAYSRATAQPGVMMLLLDE